MYKYNIIEIKKKLDELALQKENFFKAQQDKRKDIFAHINKIKELRSSYTSLSDVIRELIKKREEHNRKVREAISRIRQLNSQKKDILKNHNIKFDPSDIKYQIDHLEEKIETQALDFEKEKQIMKKINGLKKKYLQTSELKGVLDEERKTQKEIEQNKTLANQVHAHIKEIQKKSRQLKKEFIKCSKQIMHLKEEQSEYFQKFLELKKEFIKLSNISKANKKQNQRQKQELQNRVIKQKQRELEEKIKNKQKITTEDLLVFQSR